ncbi:amidohydrolase family protein [Neomoorella humiferrea]|uniref:amidohydrolase family protein n=1 Tax=Neomoorella humiferrea TaxID=676965 RepID=UPI003D92A8E7
MIIDAHVHIGQMVSFGLSITFEEAIKMADKMGVDKLFCTHLLSLGYHFDEGDALIYEGLKKYPDRILGYVTVTSPRHGKKVLDHVEKYICDYGFHGIKIYSHPKGVGSPEPWLSIIDPYMYPILEKASQWRVPVLAHATPAECDEVCKLFPELILIMAHMGATQIANGDWHKAISVARRHRNLYLDTTSSGMDLGMIEEAVRCVGAERVVWGSDVPLLDPWYEIEKIRSAEISISEKNMILGTNIERLLSLREVG